MVPAYKASTSVASPLSRREINVNCEVVGGIRLAGGGRAVKLWRNRFAMKPNTSLMRTVLVAALLGTAVPLLAENLGPGATPLANADKVAPGAPATEEPKIAGMVIPRAKGGFLGLTLENSNFKLAFYDQKKHPVPADVTRATARWLVHYSVYDERAVLIPTADGMALTSAKFVRPPYLFKLYLTLIVEGSTVPPESYVLDYHQ
jgi:hypothetical protein